MSSNNLITIPPSAFRGSLEVVVSKSHLHRLLICASLADRKTVINCAPAAAEDIKATINCLSALGAKIEKRDSGFFVKPLRRDLLPERCILPCNESGSTLRFMLPVVSALGVSAQFHMAGRLPERPLSALEGELIRGGMQINRPEAAVLCCQGRLKPGEFSLPGNISSQYISGLLLALPLLGADSTLSVTEPVESKNYIAMTLDALKAFGKNVSHCQNRYKISGGTNFISPGHITAEGDWSNAAFWLCAGAMPGGAVRLEGLNKNSLQGDRQICDILGLMGAEVVWDGDMLSVSQGVRRGITVDASDIPDLIPPIAAVAAVSEGYTVIHGAARLRLKESDRLSAIASCLNALGAKVTEEAAGLKIQGVTRLKGGVVNSLGDHRIAMMAAIASAACDGPVIIKNPGAVNKSYPDFFEKLSELTGMYN